MTPEKFVDSVRLEILQENIVIYKEQFESTEPESAGDAHWKRALTLHRSLSDADRAVLFEIMRQVMVDTLSNVFGVLDGSSHFGDIREDFLLISQSDNQRLNGGLQDLFLEAEERGRL